MNETSSTIAPAAALAAVLQELVTAYPTDAEGTATSAVLTVTDPVTGTRHTIKMQPQQVQWVLGLVADELTTCSNAHADGTGQCGHCGGTGKAGHRDPDPYAGGATWVCAECSTVNGYADAECVVCDGDRSA